MKAKLIYKVQDCQHEFELTQLRTVVGRIPWQVENLTSFAEKIAENQPFQSSRQGTDFIAIPNNFRLNRSQFEVIRIIFKTIEEPLFFIRDLESLGGTFVNGCIIRDEWVQLQHGDNIARWFEFILEL
jgi:hypothetical protein